MKDVVKVAFSLKLARLHQLIAVCCPLQVDGGQHPSRQNQEREFSCRSIIVGGINDTRFNRAIAVVYSNGRD